MNSKRGPARLRAAAEAQLFDTATTQAAPATPESLLHELQVHQLELEMQNENLRQTQAALEESRDRYAQRYAELYEFAPVGYCTLSQAGQILAANLTAAALLGVERRRLLKRRFNHLVSDADRDTWHRLFMRMQSLGGEQTCELELLRADASLRLMHVHCRRMETGSEAPTLHLALTDISERKLIEARQAALLDENTRLSRELINLQEMERADLARDLHDELSQQLVAIRAHAGAIRRRTPNTDTGTLADAVAIEASASQIYAVSHRLMNGLHPQILDSAGLAEALQALLAGWSAQHVTIRANLRLAGRLDAIGGETRIHLFRIAQECLTNVAHHAHASHARLFLGETRQGGRRVLRMVISDDGVGMDLAASRQGFGLIAMRERARILGGDFALQSRPGGGTRIAVEVPL